MCTSCKVLQTSLQSPTLFFEVFSVNSRSLASHARNDILKNSLSTRIFCQLTIARLQRRIAYQQEFSHACSDILKKSLSNVNQVRLHNQYYCFHETEDPTTEGVSLDPIQSHSLYSKLSRLPTTSYYTKSQHEISQTSTDLHLWGA